MTVFYIFFMKICNDTIISKLSLYYKTTYVIISWFRTYHRMCCQPLIGKSTLRTSVLINPFLAQMRLYTHLHGYIKINPLPCLYRCHTFAGCSYALPLVSLHSRRSITHHFPSQLKMNMCISIERSGNVTVY